MIFILLALLIGSGLPVQTAINSKLKDKLGSPFLSFLVSFGVGTIFLFLMLLLLSRPLVVHGNPFVSNLWLIWFGGVIGGLFVLENVYLVPILGTASVIVTVLLGQISRSLSIDWLELFGTNQ